MSNKWMDLITNSKQQSAVLNIPVWVSRATLDAIGEGKIYASTPLPLSDLLQLLLMSDSALLIMKKAHLHAHTAVCC
jgi:hypothetical protein